MCGITGSLAAAAGRIRDEAPNVAASMVALCHRGPDDHGMWVDDHCALGHRRLAIIDLSAAGHQPMQYDHGGLHVIFNGEIYNFLELRKELEQLGHVFVSRSDTEVILAAYRQWGTACVERLRGMFAFALWDAPLRRLYLARDRAGKKPLFYTQVEGLFHFASELQGILSHKGVARRPSLPAVEQYLARGYVPAPMTAFERIHKLLPAHWMTVDVKDGALQLHQQRYWSLAFMPKRALSFEDAGAAVRETLTDAVRMRMISDVPLGAFLSGGIDSSIVVGLMAKLSSRPVKTFSIGFEQKAYDELEYARMIAQKWATDHTEFIVKPDAISILPTLVRNFGEPFADSSAIPTYYVSKLTRQHVTVALTGDGGDESFAGYERYLANRLAETIQMFPGHRGLLRMVSAMLSDSKDMHNPQRRAKRFMAAAARPMVARYDAWLGYFNRDARQRLLTAEARAQLQQQHPCADEWLADLFALSHNLDPVEIAMAVDFVSYLPNDLLVKVDITSMASSLETRAPFLDHVYLELAASLPVHYKLRGKTSKYLLKHAFADLLPRDIRHRPKRGFGVPMAEWLRGPLNGMMRDVLSAESVRRQGWLDSAEVSRLMDEHCAGTADHSAQLWCLLMLEMWFHEMVER